MTDRETRSSSFGSIATDYDRYRPSPPPQALDWLIPPGARALLDLAAGTGAVTRELIGVVPEARQASVVPEARQASVVPEARQASVVPEARQASVVPEARQASVVPEARQARRAERVVAVEPDDRMRAVLAARCPGAEVLYGRGEDIPLPDASVDAVLICAAWHWLDPEQAVPEITRVLRPGGRLGVMWITRDAREPWVAEFNQLAREAREADRPRRGHRRRQVTFPPGSPLSAVEERLMPFSMPMTKDELAGLMGTFSGVITLEEDQRADFYRRVWSFLDRQPWDQVDLPLLCRCVRSTRLPG